MLPETPFLAVDLDVLERNIARLTQAIIHDGGKNWRPHVKAIKTPAIAHMLLRAGAIGITCAKLSEAEVMAEAGIREILIANQIVTPRKIERLAFLNRDAQVLAAVDSLANVELMGRIAGAHDVIIPLVIEVDIGMHRAGVAPGNDVVTLARAVAAQDHVRFAGVMGWEGHTTQIPDRSEKERVIRESVALLTHSADLCAHAGLPCEIVSCGGTGTYAVTSTIPGVTELQAGGGVFGDLRYRDEYRVDHELALTIWTTVTSRPTPTRIVVDGGWKAMARFPTDPAPIGLSGVKAMAMSAEHTRIDLAAPADDPKVGDRVQFVAGYSDSTVFLHDVLFATRNGTVERAFTLAARGKLE